MLQILAVGGCLMDFAWANDAVDDNASREALPIEGFWQGFWGGGEDNGVIRLPALAELLIDGNRVKMLHFPGVGNLTGTVRVDDARKKIRITPQTKAGQPMPENIVWGYEIKDNKLTLTLGENSTIDLERCQVVSQAIPNVHIELCTAKSIDEEGYLVVRRFTLLQGAGTDKTYFNSQEAKLKTKGATVLLVQKAGVKRVSVSEARALIDESTPVALAFRRDDGPSPPRFFRGEMFTDLGDVPVDNGAVYETLAKTLRPGTLAFILSTRENLPAP